MAAHARPFAGEYFISAPGIPHRNRSRVKVPHGANESYDSRQFGVLKFVRRHGGAWDSGNDEAAQILVGGRAAKLAAPQIDIRDSVAAGTMTERAIAAVQARSPLNIGLTVLTDVVLSSDRLRRHAPERQCGLEKR
jgi:hypothetical protein